MGGVEWSSVRVSELSAEIKQLLERTCDHRLSEDMQDRIAGAYSCVSPCAPLFVSTSHRALRFIPSSLARSSLSFRLFRLVIAKSY